MTQATSFIVMQSARPGATAAFAVSPHLRFRRFGQAFIFLCLRTGRYFLLRDDAARRFERLLAGCAAPADIDWLRHRQFIAEKTGPTKEGARFAVAARSSILDLALPDPGARSICQAIAAQMRARLELRIRSPGAILTPLDPGGDAPEPASPTRYLKLAAAFQRARRYFPATDQCLARGVAMKRLFDRQGLKTDLVIGVKLPFSAHCWIQAGDMALTDPLDVILPFEPILVV